MSNQKKIVVSIWLVVMLLLPALVWGQPDGPDDPPCWPPSNCPVDPQAVWLLLIASLFGYRKLARKS